MMIRQMVSKMKFTLVIDFGQDVAPDSNVRTVNPTSDVIPLTADELTEVVLNTLGVTQAGAVSIDTITRAMEADGTTPSKSKFEVVIAIDTLPSGTADANDEELTFRVRVDAGAAHSLEILPALDPVPGGLSLASNLLEVMLVNSLTPDLVAVSATDNGPVKDGENIVVTLNAGNAILPTLAADDFVVTGGIATWSTPALTITPTAGTTDATVAVDTSENGAAKITLAEVSVMVDRTPPVVTIGDPDPTLVKVGVSTTVNITVTGAATDEAVIIDEITVMQGSQVHGHGYENGVLTITPSAAGTVTVSVAADAVMDAAGNGNAAVSSDITVAEDEAADPVAVSATPSAATVDGSTPIVVTLDATAPVMVPTDLVVADFTVMEGTTALIPVWNAAVNTLTITPAGTGDTTVTIDVSQAGMAKLVSLKCQSR